MTDELTPVRCGCGGEAKVIKHEFHGASPSYGVECTNCHAESWQFYDSEAEAIKAWNRAMGAKDINVPDKERKTGKWILVSERLPEDMDRTLVTIDCRGRQNVRSGHFFKGFFMNDNGDTWKTTDPEVTAWMPLPEPWRGEE